MSWGGIRPYIYMYGLEFTYAHRFRGFVFRSSCSRRSTSRHFAQRYLVVDRCCRTNAKTLYDVGELRLWFLWTIHLANGKSGIVWRNHSRSRRLCARNSRQMAYLEIGNQSEIAWRHISHTWNGTSLSVAKYSSWRWIGLLGKYGFIVLERKANLSGIFKRSGRFPKRRSNNHNHSYT